MDAQKIAVEAVVALTDCDREKVGRLHPAALSGRRKETKRLTFKGLQAVSQG